MEWPDYLKPDGLLKKSNGSVFGSKVLITDLHSTSMFDPYSFADYEKFAEFYQRMLANKPHILTKKCPSQILRIDEYV